MHPQAGQMGNALFYNRSMRKNLVPLTVLAGLVSGLAVFTGCKHKPAAPSLLEKLQANSGFAAQVPGNVEGLCAVYGSSDLLHKFTSSKMWAELQALPPIQTLLGGALLPKSGPAAAQGFDFAKARSITKALLGDECFLVFSPGATAQFANLQQLQQEAQVFSMLNGQPGIAGKAAADALTKEAAPRLLPLVQKAEVPAVWMGFKAAAQKAAIDDGLAKLLAQKPAAIKTSDFQLAGKYPFHLLACTVRDALDAKQQAALKEKLGAALGAGPLADQAAEAVLSRHVECAYGWVGDYLLVSLGSGHDHLQLAASPADSILAKPELAIAADYQHPGFHTLGFETADMLKTLLDSQWNFTPILERLKSALLAAQPGLITPEDSTRLDGEIQQIGEKLKPLGPQKFAPMVAVSWWEHGLHSESFGGAESDALKLAGPLNFASVPTAQTFLWTDKRVNPDYVTKVFALLDYLGPVLWQETHQLALDRLPPEKKQQSAMFEQLVLPKLQEFYRITHEEFLASFGEEAALALDFQGPVPALPMLPEPLTKGLKLPRLAVIRDLQDRALLQKSAASYGAWLKQVFALLPAQAQAIPGLLQVAAQSKDGVDYSILTLPMKLDDLAPEVAVTPKLWLMGTSASQLAEITAKLAQPTPGPAAGFMLHLSMPAACAYLQLWIDAMKANPDFFAQAKSLAPQKVAADTQQLEQVVKFARILGPLDFKMDEVNGQPHTSLQFELHDLP
jgi:hypothetical protein